MFRGYLEALQEAFADSQQWRKPVAQMDQQAHRMQALVDDLLTLSRLEMADRPQAETPVPVPEMLTEIVAEARALSGEQKHDLHLKADPGTWLMGEEGELHSAFSNLIFNAVRHTPAGGKIAIEIWCRQDTGYVFTITDTGMGIAEEDIPLVLAPFGQVESAHSRTEQGTGLGLPLTKSFVELHGGSFDLRSTVGTGTTVTFRFPAERIVPKRLSDEPLLDDQDGDKPVSAVAN